MITYLTYRLLSEETIIYIQDDKIKNDGGATIDFNKILNDIDNIEVELKDKGFTSSQCCIRFWSILKMVQEGINHYYREGSDLNLDYGVTKALEV